MPDFALRLMEFVCIVIGFVRALFMLHALIMWASGSDRVTLDMASALDEVVVKIHHKCGDSELMARQLKEHWSERDWFRLLAMKKCEDKLLAEYSRSPDKFFLSASHIPLPPWNGHIPEQTTAI